MTHHAGHWVVRSLIPGPDCRNRRHDWNAAPGRRARYRLLWSLCDGFAYDGPDGDSIRRELGMYRHVRPILNPFSRIVEFQVSHLLGGRLDPAAGDGKLKPSSLPIDPGVGASKELPAAISAVWAASKWQRRKSLLSRYGTKYGDPALEVIDDPVRRKVKIRVVDPNEIEDAIPDGDGGVLRYTLERHEVDPTDPDGERMAVYREVVGRDEPGGPVVYRTFKDGVPYQWPGTAGSEWDSPFPFVPLILGQHIELGFPWGIAEHAAAIRKGVERDDQGSNLSDAARRMANGPWMLTGADIAGPKPGQRNPYAGDPFSDQGAAPYHPTAPYKYQKIEVGGRDEMPFLTCDNPDAKITPLVYPLPIAQVAAFLQMLKDGQDQDYPELQIDGLAGLSSSGEARREAKKNAAQKIVERRAGYDEMVVLAQKYAIIMGAALGYEDFAAFRGVEDIHDPRIDHSIADRPVFAMDDAERVELQKVRAEAIKGYVDAGFSLEAACYQVDMTEQDIDDVLEMNGVADEASAKAERDAMARMTGGDNRDGGAPPSVGNRPDAVAVDPAGTAIEG